jgi:hypothetical protein
MLLWTGFRFRVPRGEARALTFLLSLNSEHLEFKEDVQLKFSSF